MTADRALKKRVRARMARTGESYTAALRHLRSTPGGTVPDTTTPTTATIRLAVAQTTYRGDHADAEGFRRGGAEVRALMRRAHAAGADLLQLPEATLCFPDKRRLSSVPGKIAESDWSLFAWDALEAELALIRQEARQLSLWTVIGAQTRHDGDRRPRTSMLVIGPDGALRARYDERRLSRTKAAHMYERGTDPVTFRVGGITLGLASGLEVLFSDVFLGYEDAGADAVLFSSQGAGRAEDAYGLEISALAAARQHGLTVGCSVPTANAPFVPAGIVSTLGRWTVTCPREEVPSLVIGEVTTRPDGAARDWRRAMVDVD